MKRLWLAFEGGGTKTRMALAESGGPELFREIAGPSSPLYIEPGTYVREITPLLRRMRRRADTLGGRVTTAALAGPMDQELVRQLVRTCFGRVSTYTFGESEIALAVYGLRTGCSLIAGTGSSCWVMDEEGRRLSRGGFGPQFGDEGSSYWIAREAIAAALRALQDGRGELAIVPLMLEYFGIGTPKELFSLCRRTGFLFPPRVAGFAKHVIAAARAGDKMCTGICAAAGRALGKLVVETVHDSGLRERPVPLVLAGGVFHAGSLVGAPLKRAIRKSGIPFRVYPYVIDPTEGLFRALQMRLDKDRKRVSR